MEKVESLVDVRTDDNVVVYTEQLGKKAVGKVLENPDPRTVMLAVYELPECLPGGRQQHHSKFELLRTDRQLEVQKGFIIKKVQILPFLDFKKLYKNPKQAFAGVADVAISYENLDDFDVFFFRQRYNDKAETLMPELKPSCVCRQILNPDDDTAACPNPACSQVMHVSCLRHNADRKCYECKTEFPLKDLYSLKRSQSQKDNESSKDHEDNTHQESRDDDIEPVNKKRRKLDDPSEVKRTVYMSLKHDEAALRLDAFLKQTVAKSQASQSQMHASDIQKTREKAKESFAASLMLGVEEAKERSPLELDRILEAAKIDDSSMLTLEAAYEYCYKLAFSIESGMFARYDCHLSADYSKKYRKLTSSLRNDDNYELRLAILAGEINPTTMTDLSDSQLAPRRIREMQEQAKQNFFKEQVIIHQPVALISKSRKGEELLVINSADMQLRRESDDAALAQEAMIDQSNGTAQNVSDHEEAGWESEKEAPAKPKAAPAAKQQPALQETSGPLKDLSSQDRELLESLQKWDLSHLTTRFLDRLTHLKANQVTSEDLNRKILEMSQQYEKKQQEVIARVRSLHQAK